MKNGWDSNRWDEDWDEPYKTPEERLRDPGRTKHGRRSFVGIWPRPLSG